MQSKIDILKSLIKGEDVDLTDNHDIEEVYNQALSDGYNIQFIHDGEGSFLAMLVDVLNLYSGGRRYTIEDLYRIISESDLSEVHIKNAESLDDYARDLHLYATIFARRFNLTFHIHNLEGEDIIINGDSAEMWPNREVNFFQIDEGFAYLNNNQHITIIENIPIIDIPDDIDLGDTDDNETLSTFAINPLYREILEAADYQIFRNPGPTGLEAEIYRNIRQGSIIPEAAPQINVQTDAEQWHPEWQIILHDPNMYNIDHILAQHSPQNDPPIVGFQGTMLPSFNGIFGNMNTNEIFAFFVLVGIAFYIGNGYNCAGDCG